MKKNSSKRKKSKQKLAYLKQIVYLRGNLYNMPEAILSGSRDSLVEDHWEIMALLLKQKGINLTPKERSILTAITKTSVLGLLTKGVRGKVRRILSLAPAAFSNHTGRLKEKGLLIEEAGDLRVHPKILPTFPNEFKIKLHAREED